MKKALLTVFIVFLFSNVLSQAVLKSIDELANTSVLLYRPSTGEDGTGNLVFTKNKFFIITASHVVKHFDNTTKMVLHLPGDKPLTIDLISVSKGNSVWQIHPVADLAIIQVYPEHIKGFDTLLAKYSFPTDQLYNGSDLERDLDLTFFGYPIVEPIGNMNHFSALSFHGTLASGLITINRADNGRPCDFIFMNIPSMQGCSGSGVYFNLSKPVMIGGIDRTWMIGIVHGTQGDASGGKVAIITPLSYLKDWEIQLN